MDLVENVGATIRDVRAWFDTLWAIRVQDVSTLQAFLLKTLRVFLLTIKGFQDDNCALRASALTMYSLLSVVPVAAMAFGIAKGFGFEKMLERQLLNNIPGQEQGVAYIIDFARKLLENTKGGVIAGIGVVVLLWSVMKVLGNIESSFNYIWKVEESRALIRKFSDYLSIMLIAPVLVILSSSMSVFITSQVTLMTERIQGLQMFSPIIFSTLKLLPYALIWILFSFMYIFMPNTNVRVTSGILAGVIAGTIYQLVQIAYIYFQVTISNYNAIYGSFAALPFFVFWLQMSWFVVLLGAEISHHYQHIDTYHSVRNYSQLSASQKKLLSLHIAHRVVVNFSQGNPALTTEPIATQIDLPVPFVQRILTELVESGVLVRISLKAEYAFAYQPAKSVTLLTIKSVLDALDQHGEGVRIHSLDRVTPLVSLVQQLEEAQKSSSANILLKDVPLS